MLRWKEPAAFKRALARRDGTRRNPWYPLLLAMAIVVVCLGAAAFHNQPAFSSWPATVALVVGVGFLVGYGVPFLASLDANLLVITERGFGRRVMRGNGVDLEVWPWDEVTDCQLELMTVEGRTYKVLVVHSQGREPARFALAESVNVDDVADAIAANGRELRSTNVEGSDGSK